jgi:predicted DNA-binding ribbon-helix-helix protein
MYELDIDLTPQRRSFWVGQEVYSLVLEQCWWQALEDICPNQETRKGWLLEWIEEARAKGCNRQALIRFRIHQLVLDSQPGPGPDPKQELLERIKDMRRRLTWRKVALALNDVGLTLGSGAWSEESVKTFYHSDRPGRGEGFKGGLRAANMTRQHRERPQRRPQNGFQPKKEGS